MLYSEFNAMTPVRGIFIKPARHGGEWRKGRGRVQEIQKQETFEAITRRKFDELQHEVESKSDRYTAASALVLGLYRNLFS